jgi:hypothetical protein
MTETEWLESADPFPMIVFLFGPFKDIAEEEQAYVSRKNLLLVSACFYRLANLLPQDVLCWMDHATLSAEGHYEKTKLLKDGEETDRMILALMESTNEEVKGKLQALSDYSWNDNRIWPDSHCEVSMLAEQQEQTKLLRDIFGNPFRPITFNPSWLTSTVTALARQMYDSRDFSAMPILADALQDSGCDNAEILEHCRGPGPHVRGCWVVDKLLAKE